MAYGLLAYGSGVAAAPCLSVVYPDVREPYRTVLERIVRGIELGIKLPVKRTRVGEQANASRASRAEDACDVIVALGRGGVAAAQPHFGKRPVLVGAVFVQPGEPVAGPTYSLTPDPRELFLRLKHYAPGVKRVMVIYDPAQNGRLVAGATQVARDLGLSVVAKEAHDPREAVRSYKQLLESMDAATDALWLAGDTMTDSSVVLPMVIESSWNRKLIVFSNQAAHVKNGVLFSVFPDDERLGRRLAALANECRISGCQGAAEVFALIDLKTAVNVRTAARLGVRVAQAGPYADLILPAD